MQAFLSLAASFFLLVSSFGLPTAVYPTNQEPHDHKTESLYITNTKGLAGTAIGYCGPWSISVAERYEGHRTGEPTMEEWHDTSEELGIDRLTGGVSAQSLTDYYQRRGYDVEVADLKNDGCDSQYYAAKKMDDRCVVLVLMMSSWVGGHVETVVGVNKCKLETNSWGELGEISMKGGFSHTTMTMFNNAGTYGYLVIACK